MNPRYTRTALAELETILSSLSEQNPVATRDLADAIENVITRLLAFPRSAVETNLPGIRVATVYPYPYLIFYAIDGDTLVIRNIRHAARRRPSV